MSKAHTVICPHCGTSHKVDSEKLGKKAPCATCGASFILKETPLSRKLGNSPADRLKALAKASRDYEKSKQKRKK